MHSDPRARNTTEKRETRISMGVMWEKTTGSLRHTYVHPGPPKARPYPTETCFFLTQMNLDAKATTLLYIKYVSRRQPLCCPHNANLDSPVNVNVPGRNSVTNWKNELAKWLYTMIQKTTLTPPRSCEVDSWIWQEFSCTVLL